MSLVSTLSVTVCLHVVLSHVVSPHLFNSWSNVTHWNNLKRHFETNDVIGNVVHALVVGTFAAFSVLVHWYDLEILHQSWVPVVAAEVSVSFWLTELSTTLLKSPRSLLKDKAGFFHHVSGILCLLTALWWQGIALELTVIRLLSQLSIPLLILRLFLLDIGMSDTFFYLATFSLMIVVYFVTRIMTIPWYWTRAFVFVTKTPDLKLVLIVIFVLVSLFVDLLNIKWMLLMLRIYWKYYPERFNLIRYFNILY